VKTLEILPGWNRKQLEAFLEAVRVPTSGRFLHLNGGAVLANGEPREWFDLYSLDATWSVYVVWEDRQPGSALRSTEVIGFPDLKPRIDPGLFDALTVIHQAPSAQGGLRFGSLPLIHAVNTLQEMGKERALKALWAYYRLSRGLSAGEAGRYDVDEFRILPILQLLFEGMPGYRLGAGDVEVDHPIVAVQDVPFMLVSGYALEGRPPDAADHLRRVSGILRPFPLSPKATPLEAADELTESGAWKALNLRPGNVGRKKWQIRRQALDAAASVFALRPEETTTDCCVDPTEVQWRAAVERAKASGIAWSPEIQDFILGR
jgi:hypothetical protein